jgi:hypothetical protein
MIVNFCAGRNPSPHFGKRITSPGLIAFGLDRSPRFARKIRRHSFSSPYTAFAIFRSVSPFLIVYVPPAAEAFAGVLFVPVFAVLLPRVVAVCFELAGFVVGVPEPGTPNVVPNDGVDAESPDAEALEPAEAPGKLIFCLIFNRFGFTPGFAASIALIVA